MAQLVVKFYFVKKTILVVSTICCFVLLLSFDIKNSSKAIDIFYICIKKDSILRVQDSVFKLLHSTTLSSYYAKKFIGKLTANGEKYDANALTCAHKKLKFGTLLKITNLKNNKSILVRVNDRGPFVKNRTIDLSEKAFLAITKSTNVGILEVKVEELIAILPQKTQENDSINFEELKIEE